MTNELTEDELRKLREVRKQQKLIDKANETVEQKRARRLKKKLDKQQKRIESGQINAGSAANNSLLLGMNAAGGAVTGLGGVGGGSYGVGGGPLGTAHMTAAGRSMLLMGGGAAGLAGCGGVIGGSVASQEEQLFGAESMAGGDFVWKKKLERQQRELHSSDPAVAASASHALTAQSAWDNRAALERVRRRRIERENEREEREREREQLQRDKEAAYHSVWQRNEANFLLDQARHRSDIRIAGGRARPIDLLIRYVQCHQLDENADCPGGGAEGGGDGSSRKGFASGGGRNNTNDYDRSASAIIEMTEPSGFLQDLCVEDLTDLQMDIKVVRRDMPEHGKHSDYWRDVELIVRDEMERLRGRLAEQALENEAKRQRQQKPHLMMGGAGDAPGQKLAGPALAQALAELRPKDRVALIEFRRMNKIEELRRADADNYEALEKLLAWTKKELKKYSGEQQEDDADEYEEDGAKQDKEKEKEADEKKKKKRPRKHSRDRDSRRHRHEKRRHHKRRRRRSDNSSSSSSRSSSSSDSSRSSSSSGAEQNHQKKTQKQQQPQQQQRAELDLSNVPFIKLQLRWVSQRMARLRLANQHKANLKLKHDQMKSEQGLVDEDPANALFPAGAAAVSSHNNTTALQATNNDGGSNGDATSATAAAGDSMSNASNSRVLLELTKYDAEAYEPDDLLELDGLTREQLALMQIFEPDEDQMRQRQFRLRVMRGESLNVEQEPLHQETGKREMREAGGREVGGGSSSNKAAANDEFMRRAREDFDAEEEREFVGGEVDPQSFETTATAGSGVGEGGQGGEEGDATVANRQTNANANKDWLLRSHLWSDKYRPRKPRFFNRVHTGFVWNKYNQTHYDLDNPPPKVVQGYKFNIFYPDLIDKTQPPTYTLVPCYNARTGRGNEAEKEFAILTFKAGPPYEDIAFKICNKEWERSHRFGFRCQFQNSILQLWFHFKRFRYKK